MGKLLRQTYSPRRTLGSGISVNSVHSLFWQDGFVWLIQLQILQCHHPGSQYRPRGNQSTAEAKCILSAHVVRVEGHLRAIVRRPWSPVHPTLGGWRPSIHGRPGCGRSIQTGKSPGSWEFCCPVPKSDSPTTTYIRTTRSHHDCGSLREAGDRPAARLYVWAWHRSVLGMRYPVLSIRYPILCQGSRHWIGSGCWDLEQASESGRRRDELGQGSVPQCTAIWCRRGESQQLCQSCG